MRVLRAMGLHRPAFRLAGPLAAALMLLTLAAQPAVAGPFTDLIIFGDSLSDIGNVSTATATLTPGPSYFAGRFSNGPVYAEILASGLGLGPLSASLNGGDDYAYGGALTSGTPFPSSIVVKDLDDQVGQYLGSRTPDPEALFVVFGGANDVRNQLSATMPNVAAAASNLATDITDLYDRGARKFLVANVPALGLTPGFNNDPTQARVVNSLAAQFNMSLSTALDDLQSTRLDLTIFRLDVASLFEQLMASPSAFGLINVTDPAAPGLEPGDQDYDNGLIAANPGEYLFWDDLHPTAAAHALLGQQALLVVPEPNSLMLFIVGALVVAWRLRFTPFCGRH